MGYIIFFFKLALIVLGFSFIFGVVGYSVRPNEKYKYTIEDVYNHFFQCICIIVAIYLIIIGIRLVIL